MVPPPPISPPTYTLFPYTSLFRSLARQRLAQFADADAGAALDDAFQHRYHLIGGDWIDDLRSHVRHCRHVLAQIAGSGAIGAGAVVMAVNRVAQIGRAHV